MKLIYYRHNQYRTTPEIPSQNISFIELTLLLKGEMHYSIDRKNYVLHAGDAVFLPQTSLRARKSAHDVDYVSFNFFSEPTDAPVSLPPFIEKGVSSEIMFLLNACDEIHKKLLPDEESLSLILRCILLQLQNNYKRNAHSVLLYQIKEFIAKNMQRTVTIEEIANEVHFSPSHIAAIFKQETGTPIISYILNEKISEGKILIANGVPLQEISQLLGFADYNYFSRLFKKKVGYSPLQYKRLLSTKK